MSEQTTAPVSGQPSPSPANAAPETVSSAFNNMVGHRNLNSHENAALLARLEKNGTTLEQVNEIAKAHGVEIREDERTDAERAWDALHPVPDSAEGYHLNLASAVPAAALGDQKTIAELESHAGQFAHALQMPQAAAGEFFRDVIRAGNELARMPDAEAAAYKQREAGILTRALGGPDKLEAAMQQVSELLAQAGNPELVKAMAPGLNSAHAFLSLLHHAQRLSQRASRQR